MRPLATPYDPSPPLTTPYRPLPHLAARYHTLPPLIALYHTLLHLKVALGALQPGRAWVDGHVAALAEQKALVLEALSPLGEGAVRGGSGAIYLFVRLPEGCVDDVAVVRWLTEAHGVCLIPGSGCGMPGHVRGRQPRTNPGSVECPSPLRRAHSRVAAHPQVRVCYANLSLERTREAAARLRAGLTELVAGGVDLKAGSKF